MANLLIAAFSLVASSRRPALLSRPALRPRPAIRDWLKALLVGPSGRAPEAPAGPLAAAALAVTAAARNYERPAQARRGEGGRRAQVTRAYGVGVSARNRLRAEPTAERALTRP